MFSGEASTYFILFFIIIVKIGNISEWNQKMNGVSVSKFLLVVFVNEFA